MDINDAGRKVCIRDGSRLIHSPHTVWVNRSQSPVPSRLPRKRNVVVQDTVVLGPNPFESNYLQKLMQELHGVTDSMLLSGFGGLVVSMLTSGARVRGFEPARIILSMPSFGGEVKESVPCPSSATCKRT